MVCKLCFAPLRPHKMRALSPIGWAIWFLRIKAFASVHSYEDLLLLPMPPASAFDYLANPCVVISVANAEFEIIATRLRLYPFVLIVDGLVKFLHHFDIDGLH